MYTLLKLDFVFLCCVQGVQCVLYSLPEEPSVNEEDFDIKSRLNQSKQFLKYRNSSLVQYKEGLYVFETFRWGFCHFLIQSNQNILFPSNHLYQTLPLHVHYQQDNNMFGHKKIKSQECLYLIRHL